MRKMVMGELIEMTKAEIAVHEARMPSEAELLARAKDAAIAEVAADEKAKEDAARIDRATVLIGDPKTMAALETQLRDAKART